MGSTTTSRWSAPEWVNNLYANFPLVTLDQPEQLNWRAVAARTHYDPPYSLWVNEPLPEGCSPTWRSWAASSPASLRAQLLFLLRGIPIRSRIWTKEATAPGGKLPVLHLLKENRLVDADEIRGWLDAEYPQTGPTAKWHGLPDQTSYDTALATAQLVLSSLLPAYWATQKERPQDVPLLLANPPPLFAGLTTPLPASLTGSERSLDTEEVIEGGVDALEALRSVLCDPSAGVWALGAKCPTPLDALLASHMYCIYSLPTSSILRMKLEECPDLENYINAVFDFADKSIP